LRDKESARLLARVGTPIHNPAKFLPMCIIGHCAAPDSVTAGSEIEYFGKIGRGAGVCIPVYFYGLIWPGDNLIKVNFLPAG
jgi:hypothetical protein